MPHGPTDPPFYICMFDETMPCFMRFGMDGWMGKKGRKGDEDVRLFRRLKDKRKKEEEKKK